jgi:DtxR family Mn-dependent transcriptional regulator
LALDEASMTRSALRSTHELSEIVEDYLKAIYLLHEEAQRAGTDDRVTTSALATRLNVSPASVTDMLKRLAQYQLVRHQKYRGVELTDEGQRLALEIVRHHRLIELYLTRMVGFRWDEVHDQAEGLEHVISEEFEDKIDALLGNPTEDPHGDPIPAKDGSVPTLPHTTLGSAPIGEPLLVRRISHQMPELLRYLDTLGLRPGALVSVIDRAPFGGPVRVRVRPSPAEPEVEHAIGPEVATAILVTPSVASRETALEREG